MAFRSPEKDQVGDHDDRDQPHRDLDRNAGYERGFRLRDLGAVIWTVYGKWISKP